MAEMEILSRGVNALLQNISPEQFSSLKDLHKKATSQHPFLKGFSTVDPLLMEGRAIMFNRKTPLHADRKDPLNSWAVMTTLGCFTNGGQLCVPRLRLRMRYLPGDAVAIRGRILAHEVEEWGAGQRISVAHFTHDSLWHSYGMTCPA